MFKALRNNKGSTMVIYVCMFVVMLGMAAVVVDIGRVAVEQQRLQNAVDAAALAAAAQLPDASEAAAAATKYAVLNGLSASDIDVTFSDSNKSVFITAKKDITYVFAQILGISGTTARTSSKAQCGSLGCAFNYALFSGSKTTTLSINGSAYSIVGSTHTNNNFSANGSSITITGTCEAMKTISINGSSISVSSRVPNAAYVSMPDFADDIKQQAEQAGQYYTGNKTFNGSSIDVTEPLFVNGSITINGSKFKGVGCIFATGSITFNGSSQDVSTSDAVCIYSQTGSITINGSSTTIDGILYAPGGSINMNGSSQTVNGRVIGNTVNINGSNIKIISGTKELSSLPAGVVKLIN
jgi:hypothetical protein